MQLFKELHTDLKLDMPWVNSVWAHSHNIWKLSRNATKTMHLMIEYLKLAARNMVSSHDIFPEFTFAHHMVKNIQSTRYTDHVIEISNRCVQIFLVCSVHGMETFKMTLTVFLRV